MDLIWGDFVHQVLSNRDLFLFLSCIHTYIQVGGRLYHLGLLCDVCTMTVRPNNAFLRCPHWKGVHSCMHSAYSNPTDVQRKKAASP